MASTHEGLRRATSEIFTSWVHALAGYYAAHGIGAAHDTAGSVIALLEGAFILGRAHRSTDPVLAARAAAQAIVSAALAASDGVAGAGTGENVTF